MYYIIQPLLRVIIERGEAYSNLSANTFLLISIVLIGCCWFTEAIGLSSLIGAFQVGFFIPRNSNLSHALTEKIEYFVVGLLMPLYFTNSGLKTQFGLLNTGEGVGYAILVIVVATVSKATGTFFPCLYLGIPPRMAGVVSALMSCKGLVALIVVNYGLDYGIITEKFFAILILMVLVTTMQTVPLVDLIDPPSRAAQSAIELVAYEAMVSAREEKAKIKVAAKVAAKAKAAAKLLGNNNEVGVGANLSGVGEPESSPNDTPSPSPTGDETPDSIALAFQIKIEKAEAKAEAKTLADRNILVDLDIKPFVPALDTFSLDSTGGSPIPTTLRIGTPKMSAVASGMRVATMNNNNNDNEIDDEDSVPPGMVGSSLLPFAAKPFPPLPRLHLMLALCDTTIAEGLVDVANLFDSDPAQEQTFHSGTDLRVTWLQGELEMPSAYMNATKTVSDLRDAKLVSALNKSRVRSESRVRSDSIFSGDGMGGGGYYHFAWPYDWSFSLSFTETLLRCSL